MPLAPPQPARRLYLFDAVSDKSANTLVRELHDLDGFGGDFDADVAVDMRIADFVLEGPAAIGLKRTDPEAVPQRMYTSDYDSASGAEEQEEAADAAASTHST